MESGCSVTLTVSTYFNSWIAIHIRHIHVIRSSPTKQNMDLSISSPIAFSPLLGIYQPSNVICSRISRHKSLPHKGPSIARLDPLISIDGITGDLKYRYLLRKGWITSVAGFPMDIA